MKKCKGSHVTFIFVGANLMAAIFNLANASYWLFLLNFIVTGLCYYWGVESAQFEDELAAWKNINKAMDEMHSELIREANEQTARR